MYIRPGSNQDGKPLRLPDVFLSANVSPGRPLDSPEARDCLRRQHSCEPPYGHDLFDDKDEYPVQPSVRTRLPGSTHILTTGIKQASDASDTR